MAADSTGTPLRRSLAGDAPVRPGPLDALREANRVFQSGQRVDMQGLARTLGVDRATLYRWVGSREQLLVEVLWRQMSKTIERLRAPSADGVRPPAADILTGATQAAMTSPGMRSFLEREGELALKLLTTKAADFQRRLIELIAEVIEDDRRDGRLCSGVPLDDLPYLLVRVMESYVYTSLITGEEPDTERASRAIHALLPETTPASPAGDGG